MPDLIDRLAEALAAREEYHRIHDLPNTSAHTREAASQAYVWAEAALVTALRDTLDPPSED